MMRSTSVTFIFCTLLSCATLANENSSAERKLMFVGSVVRPLCNTGHSESVVTLSCLNNVVTGVEVEKYNIVSLMKMGTLRSRYKSIQLATIKSKPGLARVTVAYY
ncbi:hypothetical protein J4G63_07580 [Aeromonas sobria]|uniref:hypothetical protein n=1 Tax=Aeromonas sobria TaxID=646 RepID=UPI001114B64D|nr:hypothetical protein [Aeromonas sobria]MBS4687107.1 hypothetical protein [Aeromonas sobria]